MGPEIQNPQITEIDNNSEFIVNETLQSAGVQTVQKTFKSQVSDNSGKPLIQTPTTTVISVSPPSDSTTLANQSKGDTTNSLTWLATFWIRILKKALHFGWRITGKEVPNDS